MALRAHLVSDKNVYDYIPATSERSCVTTLTDASSGGIKPLDEIGLMKHGLLEKRSYVRHMVAEGNKGPVTMEEILKRGIQTADGEVVHAMPFGGSRTTSSASKFSASSSLLSTYSPAHSSSSNDYSVFMGQLKNEAVYSVGLPEERALLKTGDSKNGKRYELNVGDNFQLLLDTSPEASLLLIFK